MWAPRIVKSSNNLQMVSIFRIISNDPSSTSNAVVARGRKPEIGFVQWVVVGFFACFVTGRKAL